MGILRPQFQPQTFLPGSGGVELIGEPRPLTADDNGKILLINAPGDFTIPPWVDMPPGFTVQIQVAWVLLGTAVHSWDPNELWRYIPASLDDRIVGYGRYNSCALLPGHVLVSHDDNGDWRLTRSNRPNEWIFCWTDTDSTGSYAQAPIQARAAILSTGGYFDSVLQGTNTIYGWIMVCDENGQPDPGERVLGSFQTWGGVIAGPDGLSGGPLLPFYIHFYNSGPDDGVADSPGSYPPGLCMNLNCPCLVPPNTFNDFNWSPWDRGSSVFAGARQLSPVLGNNWTFPAGSEMSFYMGNAGSPDYTVGGVFNYYLRTAPGELTPRTWTQALALGPV